jgi:hypothetical protein
MDGVRASLSARGSVLGLGRQLDRAAPKRVGHRSGTVVDAAS